MASDETPSTAINAEMIQGKADNEKIVSVRSVKGELRLFANCSAISVLKNKVLWSLQIQIFAIFKYVTSFIKILSLFFFLGSCYPALKSSWADDWKAVNTHD